MPVMYQIHKNPDDHDSDDVVMQERFEVFGYISKKDGKIGLIRCPKCGKENYVMSVSTGQCCWCGFQANKIN